MLSQFSGGIFITIRPQESNSLGYTAYKVNSLQFSSAQIAIKKWINIMADHNRDYCHVEPRSGRGNRNYRVGTTYEIRGTSNVVGVLFFSTHIIAACRMENYLFSLYLSLPFFLSWPFHSHAWSMNDAYSTGIRVLRLVVHTSNEQMCMLLKLLNNEWWREMKKKNCKNKMRKKMFASTWRMHWHFQWALQHLLIVRMFILYRTMFNVQCSQAHMATTSYAVNTHRNQNYNNAHTWRCRWSH